MSASRPPTTSADRARVLLLLLAPAAIVLGTAVVLALSSGGFATTTWYPAALFLLALACVAALATRHLVEVRWGAARPALLAYAAFVAWGYLSILWAEVPGLAWDGANRALLYGIVLGIVTQRHWSPRSTRLAAGAIALVIAALAVAGLVDTALRDHPQELFLQGRLAWPTDYANATASLWLLGCFPAIWLSTDRTLRPVLRGLALGVAALLAQTAMLSQSRDGRQPLHRGPRIQPLRRLPGWPQRVLRQPHRGRRTRQLRPRLSGAAAQR